MAGGSPQEVAERWRRRTSAATQDYVAGVNRVTEAPGMKAAAQVDAYRAGVERSITEGKWQERVAAVPLSEWKAKAAEKGAPRIAAGVEASMPKMQRFMNELLPYQDQLKAQLEQTPRGDLETNLGRMNTFVRGMSQFRRSS